MSRSEYVLNIENQRNQLQTTLETQISNLQTVIQLDNFKAIQAQSVEQQQELADLLIDETKKAAQIEALKEQKSIIEKQLEENITNSERNIFQKEHLLIEIKNALQEVEAEISSASEGQDLTGLQAEKQKYQAEIVEVEQIIADLKQDKEITYNQQQVEYLSQELEKWEDEDAEAKEIELRALQQQIQENKKEIAQLSAKVSHLPVKSIEEVEQELREMVAMQNAFEDEMQKLSKILTTAKQADIDKELKAIRAETEKTFVNSKNPAIKSQWDEYQASIDKLIMQRKHAEYELLKRILLENQHTAGLTIQNNSNDGTVELTDDEAKEFDKKIKSGNFKIEGFSNIKIVDANPMTGNTTSSISVEGSDIPSAQMAIAIAAKKKWEKINIEGGTKEQRTAMAKLALSGESIRHVKFGKRFGQIGGDLVEHKWHKIFDAYNRIYDETAGPILDASQRYARLFQELSHDPELQSMMLSALTPAQIGSLSRHLTGAHADRLSNLLPKLYAPNLTTNSRSLSERIYQLSDKQRPKVFAGLTPAEQKAVFTDGEKSYTHQARKAMLLEVINQYSQKAAPTGKLHSWLVPKKIERDNQVNEEIKNNLRPLLHHFSSNNNEDMKMLAEVVNATPAGNLFTTVQEVIAEKYSETTNPELKAILPKPVPGANFEPTLTL